MKTHKQLGYILAFALASTTVANASVDLYNNLSGEGSSIGASPLPSGWVANQFSTGAHCPNGCELGNVTLFLFAEDEDFEGLPTTDYTVEITSDAGNAPGVSIIATLNNPFEFLDGTHETVFTASPGVMLNHNTNYWVKLTSTDDALPLEWAYAPGSGKWAYGYESWVDGFGDDAPHMMRVEVTPSAVPIPSALWLMSSAMLGLVARTRRNIA